jgi:BirA family biotin operon repressor/biotin-[acetyl-CoA-carboxylase] ligase
MSASIPTILPEARVSEISGWTLHEFREVDSTNFVARALPAWNAARADTQTAGRGRFQRTWVSDAGGLWLSAVVPVAEKKESFQVLPLVAGLAVVEALKNAGVTSLRLRWPNDIMAGELKLAGLLLDTFDPRLAVIGLGINVTNHPASQDRSLRGTAARLADLLSEPPGLTELTVIVLEHLRRRVNQLAQGGFAPLRSLVNDLWGGTPRVNLELDKCFRQGVFRGVDDRGRLLLCDASGHTTVFATHEVKMLREI